MRAALLLAVAIGAAVARHLDTVEVRGRSMAPTLLPGDRLLVVRAPARAGSVVLAGDPRDPARELVKRIHSLGPRGAELRGDNPAFSTDGRTFGLTPVTAIRWRAVLRYWPLARAGRIHPAPASDLDEPGGEIACPVPEALVTQG